MHQRPAMRRISALLFTLLLAVSSLTAADVSIDRVWPQWQDAEAFDRIREYFGKSEAFGRELVIRTDAEQRAGLYFLVRVKSQAPLDHARFVVEIVRPDSPEVRQYNFAAPLGGKRKTVELGLTGKDWPGGRDMHPVAWRVSLRDGEGRTVASEQSFLWADPAK